MNILDIFRTQEFKDNRKTVTRQSFPRKTATTAPTEQPTPPGKIRGFDAAKRDNFTADWYADDTSINQLLISSLPTMRARVRERMNNDSYAQGYKNLCISNVIGPQGVKLQAMVKGFNGERDKLANETIEKQFIRWGKYKEFCDVAGRSNWKQLLTQIYKNYVIDGEAIVRHIQGGSADPEYGYSVEVVESNLLDINLNLPKLDNGNRIVMGVELNSWNKPIAYHFLTKRDETDIQGNTDKKHIRVLAKEIIHWFEPEYVGQVRGIPKLANSLNRLKQLHGFEEAALINSRTAASKMGFLTKSGVAETTPGFEQEDDGQLIDSITPGAITVLPHGYNFEKFDSNFPNNELPDYVKSQLRAISSGLNVEYFQLASDLSSVNMSSARVGVLESREVWKGIQQDLIDNIITPIYENWLWNALVRGKIMGKKQPLNVSNIDRYLDVKWIPKRWAAIDPKKEADSSMLMIDNLIKAPSSVASDMGIDWESEVELISRDEELLKTAGLQRITPNGQDETVGEPEVFSSTEEITEETED